jgi:hypothetical protein
MSNSDDNNSSSELTRAKRYSRVEPLLDVDTFKKRYLFSVDLRDRQGNEIDDGVIEALLQTAIDLLETQLNCPILPEENVYFDDYDIASYKQYIFIQLPKYPIVRGSVSEVRLNFTDTVGISFPPSWYKVHEKSGQIQLLPNVSTLSSVLIAQTGQLLPRVVHTTRAPSILKVVYRAGIADDEDQVPPAINQAIGLSAAICLLQMIGDIGPVGSPGITSASLSIDGMSQTISTANSATNNQYGSTILQYDKMLNKQILPLLKRRFKRLSVEFI